jgi:ketosteroid isomerase-like protein/3-phenylpropionate/cinnamic acid dioxygenase small subunit
MRDEEQIRLALALYSRYNDYKDEEAWTLLYAPDAVVVARAGQEWHGRNAIRAFMRDINTRQGDRDTCHFSGNVVIAIDGDTAKLDADMLFHERASGDDAWRNSQLNRYTADLVRSHSGWLFSRWMIQPRMSVVSRSVEMAAAAPLPGSGEINKTLALYAHFLDDHDAENWSQLFAPDARFTLASGEITGRQAIKDTIESMWANNPERRIVHFCTSSVLRAEATTAAAETEISEYEAAADGTWQCRGHGRYYDQLVSSGGRWLIQERRVRFPM